MSGIGRTSVSDVVYQTHVAAIDSDASHYVVGIAPVFHGTQGIAVHYLEILNTHERPGIKMLHHGVFGRGH